jgi:DNA-binding transcriptional LysR family regulator
VKLQQLACFCATAREGSFSAAARALRLSQPSVSDQVHRLEAELHTRLVISNGRGVTLTADGRAFRLHAERVLAGAEAAAASVGSGSGRATRTLSLGLTRNAPYYPFDELVERALEAQPDLRLRLPGQNSSVVAEAVRCGDLQAAVVILPVDPDGLSVQPLFRDEVLFVSADPGRLSRPVSVEDLTTAPLILYDTGAGFADPTRRQLATRAQETGVALVPRFDVEHPESALQLAARGLGDTIAARAITRNPGFPAGLGSAPFADPLYDSFALITRAGVVTTALQTLLHVVQEWAATLPDRFELERA